MPTRKSGARLRRQRLDLSDLTVGRVAKAFGAFTRRGEAYFADIEAAQAFWNKNRQLLMQWWFDGVPGDFPTQFGFEHGLPDRGPHDFCRPRFWWQFDRPERKRIIGAQHSVPRGDGFWGSTIQPLTDQEQTRVEDLFKEGEYYGEPKYGSNILFEDEVDYLIRLNLLTHREKALLAKAQAEGDNAEATLGKP